MSTLFTGLLLTWLSHISTASFCHEEQFHYEYTECDSSGQRWRVAVPSTGVICDSFPPPQRAINCSFSCKAGHYLDISTQTCRACSAGRYSLGGGIRFEEFVTLPAGFAIENFDEKSDVFTGGTSQTCPPEMGWLLRDSELIYITSPCVSKLSFFVNLVRPGYVDFSYRMPKNNKALSLSVDVRNQQCQSYREVLQSMLTKGRSEQEETGGDWRRRRLEMRTGPNVISWTVSNSAGSLAGTEPIRVSRIDVIGMAFTRECTLCPGGSYSREGAAECSPCAPGYFSTKGSSECGRCPESEYSGPKSDHCLHRPPCASKDFYAVTEPCNSQGKTRRVYKMVQPAVCRTDTPGAASLPPPEPEHDCPKCSPGMAKDSRGICSFCGKDSFSDGNGCKRCPVDTVPSYGYTYTQWETLPPNLHTKCEFISEEVVTDCDIGAAWLPSGSALVSAPSLQRGIAMELIIEINEGFHNPLASRGDENVPVSHFTVVFETICIDFSCTLYVIEDTAPESRQSSFFRFLAVFNGSNPRRVWSHSISKRTPAKFMIAFLRSRASSGEDSLTDQARILSINVTNVGEKKGKQGGGASECLACPKGGGGSCVPCPAGSFMNPQDHSCAKCPLNHVVNASASLSIGKEACIPCGTNLGTIDGVSCSTDGLFSVNGSAGPLSYDLRPWLNASWKVDGVKVFTREGASYFHLFNISLLGEPRSCTEDYNIEQLLGYEQQMETLTGAVCRLTALPGKNSTLSLVSPVLLATRLSAITTNRTDNGWKLTDQLLEYESMSNSSRPLDVHFWYESVDAGTSEACPYGYKMVVTARCNPSLTEAKLRLPHSCPDGTCDGCLFHIIAEGAQACPTCRSGDYQKIKGECRGGRQTVHFIPSKHCVLTGAAADSRVEACSVLSSREKFLLGMVIVALVLLSITLFVVFRRNRRLEYKYTRLVESRTGELPAAETCGLEEDEDEEFQDRVTFSKGRTKFFSRGAREKSDFVPLNNED